MKCVLKFGSNLLVGKDGNIDENFIEKIASEVSKAMDAGHEIFIVSSGAKAGGYGILKSKGAKLSEKQALCAIGQIELMKIYSEKFKKFGKVVSQLLLTREDFSNRKRFINIMNTINSLKHFGVVPIINENDTVATEEIKVGDNDTLSAYLSIGLKADILALFSVVDGVLDQKGKVINEFDEKQLIANLGKTNWGSGGILTKIKAAKMASDAGITAVITNGRKIDLAKILNGKIEGTIFKTSKKPNAKKAWIGFVAQPRGKIYIDDGAKDAILKGKSLLPVGVILCEGKFSKDDIVEIINKNQTIAMATVNLPSYTIKKIINNKLKGYDEICHADEIMILAK
ncbi:MAG: glutamate 5-kinase [Mesoaciditoga sp.]|uniref:glutamate 5-kinase n=1 Tax=Athalassotoga sp. TaxID=2022597 RepID=UPI000CB0085C|nr:MAG: glutamate 5-kinase [Mesoaciditoga sp.]PMP79558.1 MAG: glutamate 5-kinase [Mesoaciditoga sp.]HEU24811.1 glutamate 5-kinase [Mesoaciditoga lauensis]